MANRPATRCLATCCPFCQTQIVLSNSISAMSVCPNCGLRFALEAPQRAGELSSQQNAAPETSNTRVRRKRRLALPAAVLALASAATAALAVWALQR